MAFNKKSIATFNNVTFSPLTIEGMSEIHASVTRLYEASKHLKKVAGQSAVARLLGVLPQTLNNWEDRGISREGALLAQKNIGCDANWLLENAGKMEESTWAPVQQIRPSIASEPTGPFRTREWPFHDVLPDQYGNLTDYSQGQVEGFVKSLLQDSKNLRTRDDAATQTAAR